jgi:RNA polymerase sigma factor (sigma-70 family)
LRDKNQLARLQAMILPHLDAAFNLARWLTRNDHDAEDVVQEAYLRAHRFFDSFHGTDGKAWLLAIVRNTTYTWLERNRPADKMIEFQEARHGGSSPEKDPQDALLQREAHDSLRRAIEDLPPEFRDAIILREFEGLSYKEIAQIVGAPIGTVMSRLARGRERLQQSLAEHPSEDS